MQRIHFHRYFTGLLITFFVVPLGSSALDRATSGRILDDFKERQEELLFNSLNFTETGASDLLVHEYTMN